MKLVRASDGTYRLDDMTAEQLTTLRTAVRYYSGAAPGEMQVILDPAAGEPTLDDLGYCLRHDCPNFGGVWQDCPREVNGAWVPWPEGG